MKTINTKEFLGVLKKLKPGISTKGVVQSSDCYIFDNHGITTFNDNICVTQFFEYDGPCEKVAVPYKELFNLVSRIHADTFNMEFTDSDLKITTKRIKSTIRVEQNPFIPIEELLSTDINTDLIQDYEGTSSFNDVLKACIETTSSEEQEIVLDCVHLFRTGIESTNKHEITRAKIDVNIFPDDIDSVLIPSAAAKELCNFGSEQVALTSDGAWLWASDASGTSMYCRLVRASYLDIDSIFKSTKTNKKVEILLPVQINEVMERVLVFSREDKKVNERITFSIQDGLLQIVSSNERGGIDEKTRIRYEGEPISFTANPHSLYRIVKYNRKIQIHTTTVYTKTDNGIEILIRIAGADSRGE